MNNERYNEFKNYWTAKLAELKGRNLNGDELQEIDACAQMYAMDTKRKLEDYFIEEVKLSELNKEINS